MAKLGFYDIVTIECLNREYETRKQNFKSIPDYDSMAAEVQQTGGEKKREKKGCDKEILVTLPQPEMRGHTGYLTFAIKF